MPDKLCQVADECLPVETPDSQCCGSNMRFCVATGKCEVVADFANICGQYNIPVLFYMVYVSVCPSGLKFCNATHQCEPRSTKDELCCSNNDKFCHKTGSCEPLDLPEFECKYCHFVLSFF